jgi:hypothetical protein
VIRGRMNGSAAMQTAFVADTLSGSRFTL